MAVKDIMLGIDGDLLIQDGDIVLGDSDDQHNQHLLVAAPGLIRRSPLSGIGMQARLKGQLSLKEADKLNQEVQLQLQADGVQNPVIKLNSIIDLNIDGTR